MNVKNEESGYWNKTVVVDTQTSWVYIGMLQKQDETFFTLADADAFDLSETSLSKHEYIMMVKKDGLAPNRKEVKLLKSKVVAMTLLEDII